MLIVVTGPESSGKTFLCNKLALYFNIGLTLEYSREYLYRLHIPYTFDDLAHINKTQQAFLEEAMLHNDLHIADSDWLNTYIWAKRRFKGKDAETLVPIVNNSYQTHYLLCEPTMSWKWDPLRENPMDRGDLFKDYMQELYNRKLNYSIVSGIGKSQISQAIFLVKNCLLKV